MSSDIPKIIHRIWLVFNPQKPETPTVYKEFDLELKKLHPDWQIMEWNDQTVLSFISEYYPEFIPTYMSYDMPTKKHDASRYLIINHYGGVFIQHSIKLQKNIEPLLNNADLVFSLAGKGANQEIVTSFFAGVAHHNFWKNLISDLPSHSSYPPLHAAGPLFLTKHVHVYFNSKPIDLTILGEEVLFPFDWDEKNDPLIKSKCILDQSSCFDLYPNAYGYCLWVGSWIENRLDQIKEIEDARLSRASIVTISGEDGFQEQNEPEPIPVN